MARLTRGERAMAFSRGLKGPQYTDFWPLLKRVFSPLLNCQSMLSMSEPTISMSRMSPQPRPISCAIQMNLMLRGSKPIIFAATASMAT